MARRLTDEAVRCLGAFEAVAGVEAVDCVIDEEHDRVAFVVPKGRLADAIGPDGRTVRAVERRLNRDVALVEAADRAEDFVANALRPAAVRDVTIDDGDEPVARVTVADADRGAAIGEGGRTIELARHLARRHFDLADVELR